MAATAVTLYDLEGHSPVACLFKCNPSNICAAFYTISTDGVLARFLCISRASCIWCFSISIHSWDTTTFALRKVTNAIWKFYIRFRFWTFYRHLRVILQGWNKFCLNSTVTKGVMTSFFCFLFYHISPSGKQRTICVLNFNLISQSTAKLLLLLVAEDKRSPYLNSTPSFDELFAVISMRFCTGLPNFMQVGWSPTELWRHIDFTRWRP